MTKGQRNLAQLRKDLENIYGLEGNQLDHFKFLSNHNYVYRISFTDDHVLLDILAVYGWGEVKTINSNNAHINDFKYYLNGCTPVK